MVFIRQWTQWSASYAIRYYLKEHTPLSHNQASTIGILGGTLLSMPADMTRSIIQDPRNKNLSLGELGKTLITAGKNRTLLLGGFPRTFATFFNFELSIRVMGEAENFWSTYVMQKPPSTGRQL